MPDAVETTETAPPADSFDALVNNIAERFASAGGAAVAGDTAGGAADDAADDAAVEKTAQAVGAADGEEPEAAATEKDGSGASADADAAGGEDEDDDETDDADEDAEFRAAMERHKAPSLDDVPEAARPLVQKKLRQMDAAFTRAMQDARAYRQEEAQYRQERAAWEAQTKDPVGYIVDRLQADPTLLEKVNNELERLQEPYYAEARKRDREAAEKLARIEARESFEAAERRAARAQTVIEYSERAAQAAGVPFDLVQEAIAYQIKANERATGTPDITEAQIEAIVRHKAAIYRRHLGATKREDRKRYIAQKAEDRKATTPKVPARTGTPPGNAPAKKPMTLEEAHAALERDMVARFANRE